MMRIAVPINKNYDIDAHFGHCEFYGIYAIMENKEIIEEQVLKATQGCGCKSNIATVLASKGVTAMEGCCTVQQIDRVIYEAQLVSFRCPDGAPSGGQSAT